MANICCCVCTHDLTSHLPKWRWIFNTCFLLTLSLFRRLANLATYHCVSIYLIFLFCAEYRERVIFCRHFNGSHQMSSSREIRFYSVHARYFYLTPSTQIKRKSHFRTYNLNSHHITVHGPTQPKSKAFLINTDRLFWGNLVARRVNSFRSTMSLNKLAIKPNWLPLELHVLYGHERSSRPTMPMQSVNWSE